MKNANLLLLVTIILLGAGAAANAQERIVDVIIFALVLGGLMQCVVLFLVARGSFTGWNRITRNTAALWTAAACPFLLIRFANIEPIWSVLAAPVGYAVTYVCIAGVLRMSRASK